MALRWKRIGILAGALFAINMAGRLISKFVLDENSSKQNLVAIFGLGAIALTFAVLAFVWGRVRQMGVVAADLAGAAVVSCALIVLAGPLLIGQSPFSMGAGDFFEQIWQYAAIVIAASLLGGLVLVATGQDLRTKQLKRFAQTAKAKPKRV
jgi:multisubunit Na+/H+ antiporter MnhF subunit